MNAQAEAGRRTRSFFGLKHETFVFDGLGRLRGWPVIHCFTLNSPRSPPRLRASL